MNCLEPLRAEDGLSQGDVIVWSGNQDCLAKAAVIVTADCDLARGKHWGRVTVVPIIPAQEYFDQFYLPKQLESMEPDLLPIFGKELQNSIGTADGNLPTELALDTLLNLETLPEIVSISETAMNLHSVIRQARGLETMKSAAQTLDKALSLRNPSTKALSANKIQAFLNNPPGDCMILPAMEGLEPGIHVAFLRILRELRDEDIALKTSQKNKIKGQRVGRLIPVVRYRLTQMLAQVFSDIGLPDSYETGLKDEKNEFLTSLKPKGDVA